MILCVFGILLVKEVIQTVFLLFFERGPEVGEVFIEIIACC